MKDISKEKLLEEFNDLLKIQTREPMSYTDPYMQGMANGMLVMRSVLTGESPDFISLKKSKYRHRK